MNSLEFFASLIDSLAWPSCVLVVAYFLRAELPTLISGLRKLKYKDIELEFEKSSKAVAEKVKIALPRSGRPIRISGQSQEELLDRLNSISELAPRSSIHEAWLLVESAAIDAVRKAGVSSFKSHPGPMRLRDYLVKAGLLNPDQQAIFEQLRRLRNEAVHAKDAEFTQSSVESYIESALHLAIYLEGCAGES